MAVKKKIMGRPLKEIDEKTLRALARVQCTYKEMANEFGCSVDTLENRFSEVIEAERDIGKMSLRRKQYEVAMDGSVPMLTWLGRCWLGQKDYETAGLKEIKELLIKVHPSRLNEEV